MLKKYTAIIICFMIVLASFISLSASNEAADPEKGIEVTVEDAYTVASWQKLGVVYDSGFSWGVQYPYVLYHEGIYKMWYAAMSGPTSGDIYYATSPDGDNWSNHQLAISRGSNDYVVSPSVLIEDDGTYRMWYTCRSSSYDYSIVHATSSDGISWTIDGAVLGPGPSGSWDDEGAVLGKVFKDESTYKMYYFADDGFTRRIALATSADGYSWTRVQVLMSPHGIVPNVHGPFVMKNETGKYNMIFQSTSGGCIRLYEAESDDGLTWSEPWLSVDVGEAGESDSTWVACPYIYKDSILNDYVLYYTGRDGSESRIMKAIRDFVTVNNTKFTDYSVASIQVPDDIYRNEAVEITASIYLNSNELEDSWTKTGVVYDSPYLTGATYPYVIYHEGIYKMWYAGMYGPTSADIYYTTSTDCLNWENNQIAITTPADNDYTVAPSVIVEDDGTYKMWFSRRGWSTYIVGIATSVDGLNWVEHGTVLTAGPPGTYDDAGAVLGKVIKDEGMYKMYYFADDGNVRRFALATSPDGYNWTRVGIVKSPTAEVPNIHTPFVRMNQTDGYEMYHQAKTGAFPQAYKSISNDGVNWSESEMIMDFGQPGDDDSEGVCNLHVMYDPILSKKVMFYSGYDGSEYRIMRAIENITIPTFNASFYLDVKSPENLINTVSGIAEPGNNVTVSTTWTPQVSGNHTIYVEISDTVPKDTDIRNNTAFKDIYIHNTNTATATGPQGAHHNSTITITYEWTGNPDGIDLYYSTDTGATWNYLVTDNSVDGSYNWVPDEFTRPKPLKFYWIANANNGDDDVGIPTDNSDPEAGPFNWKIISHKTITLMTNPGWNIIAVMIEPENKGPDNIYTAFDLLQEVERDSGAGVYSIARFDGGNPGTYTIFDSGTPNGAPNDFEITNTEGYWLYSSAGPSLIDIQGQNITNWGVDNVKHLNAGWNLLGFPHNYSYGGAEPGSWDQTLQARHFTDGTVDPDLMVGGAAGNTIIVTRWISELQMYESYVVNETFAGYEPSDWNYESYYAQGYWLWVENPVTITFDTDY